MSASIETVRAWLDAARAASQLQIETIGLSDCAPWTLREGGLHHASGRFFAIRGVRAVPHSDGHAPVYLPLIDQPEVAWQGFIVRPRGAGDVEWLLQAKTEPGNVGGTQIAPSIQATRSNYKRVHQGQPTPFLHEFETSKARFSDAPHSEQGTRFLWKLNRNSIIAVPPDWTPPADGELRWIWASAQAVREALAADSFINTDARSVIASAPWSLLCAGAPLFRSAALMRSFARAHTFGPALPPKYFNQLAQGPDATVRCDFVPLDALPGWCWSENGLAPESHGVGVGFIDVSAADREVARWRQPIITDTQTSECVLLVRPNKDEGVEVLLRPCSEPGFGVRREFGPSYYSGRANAEAVEHLVRSKTTQCVVEITQSDEGARFFKCMARYRVLWAPEAEAAPRFEKGGIWVSLRLLQLFTLRAASTTNELRTLVSLLLSAQADRFFADLEV
ncbi:MAG: NDP-hexose 2,3-dehydratase family protein [Maricaulaceae bacterium]